MAAQFPAPLFLKTEDGTKTLETFEVDIEDRWGLKDFAKEIDPSSYLELTEKLMEKSEVNY